MRHPCNPIVSRTTMQDKPGHPFYAKEKALSAKAVFSSPPDSAPPDSGGTVDTLLNTVAFCFYLVIIVPSLTN